jgi:hypothetical protein
MMRDSVGISGGAPLVQTEALQTPVIFIVFKRPDTTRRVFAAISQVRPAKLLVIADGPRNDRPAEAEACRQVREIVSHVDWPCEVFTNFSESNLGFRDRIISGLDWAFSLVEEAIILEDDCLPDLSFFPFCQEMLERYRGDARLGSISGTNLVEKYSHTEASYYFSNLGGIWGWATWRSKWQQLDRHLADWPRLRDDKMLSEIFDDPKAVAYWSRQYDDQYEDRGVRSWDTLWLFTLLKNNALSVVPRVNIGFGPGATNTAGANSRLTPPAGTMEFPLRHPSSFVPLRSADRRFQNLHYLTFFQRVSRKIHHIAGMLLLADQAGD